MPPLPFSPVKFSGLIERVSASAAPDVRQSGPQTVPCPRRHRVAPFPRSAAHAGAAPGLLPSSTAADGWDAGTPQRRVREISPSDARRHRLLRGARLARGRRRLDPADLDELERHFDELILKKEKLAFDWAWDDDGVEGRAFVQDRAVVARAALAAESPTQRSAGGRSSSARRSSGSPSSSGTTSSSASRPHKSAADLLAPGRGLLGPQPRRQGDHLLDPAAGRRRRRNGCMHFIDGGHRDGVLDPPSGRRACRATCCAAGPTSHGPSPARSSAAA